MSAAEHNVSMADRLLLPDVESGLLAVIFSACDAQTLLRLEVALGARLGVPFCSSFSYRLNWVSVLKNEGGLSLDLKTTHNQIDDAHTSVPSRVPSREALRGAFQNARVSLPVDGGWQNIDPSELDQCSRIVRSLHTVQATGRAIINPETRVWWGTAERIDTPVHFDLPGCFQGGAWEAIERSFRTDTPLPDSQQWCAYSGHANLTFAGCPLQAALTLRPFFLHFSFGYQNPRQGLIFALDLQGLEQFYTQRPESQICLDLADLIHVAYIMKCGSIQRTGRQLLKYCQRSRQVVERDNDYLWRFSPDTLTGQALRIDAEYGSADGVVEFCIDEGLADACWNNRITRGTDMVPLRCLPGNEFVAQQPAQGSLAGCVALVRRGGGLGFAQKASAVQFAGAVACIIYEAPGDQEMFGEVFMMGTFFQDVEYPPPGIPTILVNAADAQRLLLAEQGGACARVHLGRSIADLRRPPQTYQTFQRLAAAGEPVHVSLLFEIARCPDSEIEEEVQAQWFDGHVPLPNDATRIAHQWIEIAEVTVHLADAL